MEFVEFCVGSGTLPSRRYSHTVLDKTTKSRSFYIISSFGLGELKMSHRWDNSWWNFFVIFLLYSKERLYFFNTFSLSFTSVSSTLFHWKLRFKQTTTLMVHYEKSMHVKGVFLPFIQLVKGWGSWLESLPERLNRWVNNTLF